MLSCFGRVCALHRLDYVASASCDLAKRDGENAIVSVYISKKCNYGGHTGTGVLEHAVNSDTESCTRTRLRSPALGEGDVRKLFRLC